MYHYDDCSGHCFRLCLRITEHPQCFRPLLTLFMWTPRVSYGNSVQSFIPRRCTEYLLHVRDFTQDTIARASMKMESKLRISSNY